MRKFEIFQAKTHGITLVSLVITIIVLIILAGISLVGIMGENGITSKSQKAKRETVLAQARDKITVATRSASVIGQGEIYYADLKSELDKQFGENGYQLSDEGDEVWTITVNTSEGIVTEDVSEKATSGAFAAICDEGVLVMANTEKDINSYLTNHRLSLVDGTEIIDFSNERYYYNPSSGDCYLPEWTAGYSIDRVEILNEITPKSCVGMFEGLYYLESINTNMINTKRADSMAYMFSGCGSLRELDLSSFNTKNVKDMSFMFYDCYGLRQLDVSSFDTSKVTNMSDMFTNCCNLVSLDLSSFDTINVTDMSGMFCGTDDYYMDLTFLDISNFNTSNVTNMSHMFSQCVNLVNLDLSSFDTSNVTNMSGMFGYCYSLKELDLTNFDTKNVIYMYYMFRCCGTLETIYVSDNFVTDKVTNQNDSLWMFEDCFHLIGGNGTTYDSSKTDNEYARIDTATTPGYFSVISDY